MVVTTEGLPLSTPQLPVLLAEGLLKAAVLLRLEVLGIFDPVGKVLLGHPVLGMIMGELIVDPMAELGGALIVGILQVGRDITEAALLDLGEGPVNCADSRIRLWREAEFDYHVGKRDSCLWQANLLGCLNRGDCPLDCRHICQANVFIGDHHQSADD